MKKTTTAILLLSLLGLSGAACTLAALSFNRSLKFRN